MDCDLYMRSTLIRTFIHLEVPLVISGRNPDYDHSFTIRLCMLFCYFSSTVTEPEVGLSVLISVLVMRISRKVFLPASIDFLVFAELSLRSLEQEDWLVVAAKGGIGRMCCSGTESRRKCGLLAKESLAPPPGRPNETIESTGQSADEKVGGGGGLALGTRRDGP
ncbi:hypothetical protein [Streptomyces adustus]